MVATVSTVKFPAYYEKPEFTTWKNKKDKENYYSENNNVDSFWYGKGCEQLGLTGQIKSGDFTKLINGIHPLSNERLFTLKEVKYIATDLTLSAPKDFSIVYNLSDAYLKEDLNIVFMNAYKRVAKEIEKRSYRRLKYNKKSYDTKLLMSCFRHHTSRGVNGDMPDMQEHIHTIISRKCLSEDNKIKTLENHPLFNFQKLYGTIFRAELANGLRNIGFKISQTEEFDSENKKIKSFKIDGISNELRQHYSKRRNQINEVAELKGKSTAIDKFNIAQSIKSPKVVYKESIIRDFWKKEAKELFGVDEKFIDNLRNNNESVTVNRVNNFIDYNKLIEMAHTKTGKLFDMHIDQRMAEQEQYSGINYKSLKNELVKSNVLSDEGNYHFSFIPNTVKLDNNIYSTAENIASLNLKLGSLMSELMRKGITTEQQVRISIQIMDIQRHLEILKKKIMK